MSAAIVAFGAISGLGRGAAAASAGEIGAPARIVVKEDAELAASKLARPFCGRAPIESSDEDRATTILRGTMDDLFRELDARIPGWRDKRVGLALASSSGGMRSAMELFEALHSERQVPRELGERATYFAPVQHAVRDRFSPSTLVLTACSASTIAIGIAMGWLEGGACDLVQVRSKVLRQIADVVEAAQAAMLQRREELSPTIGRLAQRFDE